MEGKGKKPKRVIPAIAPHKLIKKRTSREYKFIPGDEIHRDKVKTALFICGQRNVSSLECLVCLGTIGYSEKEVRLILQDLEENSLVCEEASEIKYPVREIGIACERFKPSNQENIRAFECLSKDGKQITSNDIDEIINRRNKMVNGQLFDKKGLQILGSNKVSKDEFSNLFNWSHIVKTEMI